MLFLNISTDQIHIEIKNEKINLDRNNVENIIWPKLVELYKKHSFKKVVVINWPGWFTNLRVWTLALNLLNSLENRKIEIYSITKIKLLNFFVQKKILPNKWIIYIWQKKNVRLYDFKKWDYKTIKKDEINYNNKNIFFDLVYEIWYFDKKWIDIFIKDNKLFIKTSTIEYSASIKELSIKPQKVTEAQYFIQPIMGKQWQQK